MNYQKVERCGNSTVGSNNEWKMINVNLSLKQGKEVINIYHVKLKRDNTAQRNAVIEIGFNMTLDGVPLKKMDRYL
ncbi:hypothetical protein L6452_13402 [Arctium lappa]|uniref:Uncharacterized protein n=1 Tax=Arctium lappa TaxID=4217 RepID=A0ACB9CI12_ARCLA|nr:hypothetical protein L6452_13402 [Arctium lappa]